MVDEVVQIRERPDPATFVGSGGEGIPELRTAPAARVTPTAHARQSS